MQLGNDRRLQAELACVTAFVTPSKRARYRCFLSSAKLRSKFTSQLAHFADCDPRCRLPLPAGKLSNKNIASELLVRSCPSAVFVISEDPSLDQSELPLLDALDRIVGAGTGAVLACIPGQLAFVETEDERFILERPAPREQRL